MTDQSNFCEILLSTFFGFYCPNRGMGENPSPLDEDFSLFVDAVVRFKDSRI